VALTETALRQRAYTALAELLPAQFELSEAADATWQLRDRDAGASLIRVEVRQALAPRDVSRRRDCPSPQGPSSTDLVVAPWLSPRTRHLLEEFGYSYLDLTGNVRLSVERPAVYLRLQGADRDPYPPPAATHRVRLQGAKARRLVRLLVEADPPYRSTDLANAGGLTPGYVSKLLEAFEEQALLERDRRGVVKHADWRGLLMVAAERYNVLRNNLARTFVAQSGARNLYSSLRGRSSNSEVAVTGSFAVADIAHVTAPTQLMLYVSDVREMQSVGRLLPTDRGADVVLLQPEDPAQLKGLRTVDGLAHVGLSQLALDCLSGNGRLPEEGQAVLDWMRSHEQEWRGPMLSLVS
jgi:hypothetical protein